MPLHYDSDRVERYEADIGELALIGPELLGRWSKTHRGYAVLRPPKRTGPPTPLTPDTIEKIRVIHRLNHLFRRLAHATNAENVGRFYGVGRTFVRDVGTGRRHRVSVITKCKSCGAPIAWLRTEAGRSMPTDASSVSATDETFDPKKHKSHFATCPNANKHRRPRR